MDYENLLEKAYQKLPEAKSSGERFKIPIADTINQGNQTIIKNFIQICQALRRKPSHVLRFLTKELAAPGSFDQTKAMFQSKVPQRVIQQKIELYVKDYVFCRECHRPDTKLIKEDRITFLKCEACGAKSSVKSIK